MPGRIIALAGPTAVGKTAVSIELAKLLVGEIVSADSVAVYRGLDIGSAKPTAQESREAVFHLIDICDPGTAFSAGDFQKAAQEAINDILSRNRTAIVAGGSGLYLKAAVDGLNMSLPGENPEFREQMRLDAERYGVDYVHQKLIEVDPVSAQKIPAGNLKRVIRTLEISIGAGRPASEIFEEDSKRPSVFPQTIFYGLSMPREKLYDRINARVDSMLECGLVEEVKRLLSLEIPLNSLALQSLGYKEIIDYINNKCSIEQAADEIKKNTRRFAKRQYTWFKADKRIRWIEVHNTSAEKIAVMIKESLPE